ncbi:MAG: sulfatase-like hydrolase/transferase [Candidatus Pacebacteria bacterium]|nr:sulfatase-like hydrolase/transferase [Candidatus Paceibacterota bacterium]
MKNILFITMDQLRYDALGFMNAFPVHTPNMDSLARSGTVFRNAYCSNPLCVPARASIMTGKYCCDTGTYYNDQGWADALDTVPGELSKNGYFTVSVGKMHFLPARKHYGFDKRVADNNTDYIEYLAEKGLEREKAPPFNSWEDRLAWEYQQEKTKLADEDYVTNYITRNALQELESIKHRRDCERLENEPFFMWLSYVKPHSPCDPPEPYFSMYDPTDMPDPAAMETECPNFPHQVARWKKDWESLSSDMIKRNRAKYMGCVTMLDNCIGQVIEKLRELEIYDNTLIVVSSDHGDYLGDHFMVQKGFFHDCSSKVPLIVTGPGIPAGQEVQHLASHIDLLPTFLDYAGLIHDHNDYKTGQLTEVEHPSDATSLLPLMQHPDAEDHRMVVSESGIYGLSVMLRKGNTKINYYDDTGEIEVFDLEQDPDELSNLGTGMTQDDIPAEFQKTLDDVLMRLETFRTGKYTFGNRTLDMFT